jgi:hypothetical protein
VSGATILSIDRPALSHKRGSRPRLEPEPGASSATTALEVSPLPTEWVAPVSWSRVDTAMTDLPIEVYGINLLVRLVAEDEVAVQLHCPKGAVIRYGEVVTRGDGFDADGSAFRAMPHVHAIATFEDGDEATGHTFVVAGEEYRLITVDDVLVCFPPRWGYSKRRRSGPSSGPEPVT